MIASGSGRNRHAFWPLTEPLAADEVERGNRRLAHALGADPASADAARILRVPATYSHKHQPPVPVDALRLDIEQRIRAADVVGGLPDPPQAPRTTSHPPVPGGRRGDDPLLSIEPAVYVQRLLSVEVPRHRKVACPFHPDRPGLRPPHRRRDDSAPRRRRPRHERPGGPHGRTTRMNLTVRVALPDDLIYIMSLMRANRESVGGLPTPAVEERISRQTLLLALLNDDPCGYLLYDYRDSIVRIPQACIQYDARRRKYGEALIYELMRRYADAHEIRLRCAADLEANLFWRDMGFTCTATLNGGRRRGRRINSWTLWLTPRLIALAEIAIVPGVDVRQDCRYDDSGFLDSAPDGFGEAVELPKIAWANRK